MTVNIPVIYINGKIHSSVLTGGCGNWFTLRDAHVSQWGIQPFIQTYQNWSVKILSLCLSQDQLDPKVVRLGHNGKGSKTSLRTVFSEEKFVLQAGTLKPLIKIDRLHFATLAEPEIVSAK